MKAEIILKGRFWILSLIALISFALFVPLSKMGLDMDNSPERFAASGDPAFAELAQLQKRFGRDDLFVLLIEGDVFSPSFFSSLQRLNEILETEEYGCKTTSMLQAPLVIDRKGKKGLFSLKKAHERNLSSDEIRLGAKHLEKHLLSSDGRWTAIWCQTAQMDAVQSGELYEKLEALPQQYGGDAFRIFVSGGPAFVANLDRTMQLESQTFGGLAFVLMLLFLAVYFRKTSMIIGPFLVMQLGIN